MKTLRNKGIATLLAVMLALPGGAHTLQGIENPRFATLRVTVGENPISYPVITPGGDEHVVISFDEFAEDVSDLRYELIHCNADWEPSGLTDFEVLDGFNEADVTDARFSRGTTVHYINYRITLPNEQMRPMISGNYVVRVYPQGNPDETLLQARFSIAEGSMSITDTLATARTDRETNGTTQQVSFAVEMPEQDPRLNLYTDLRAVVSQNGRADRTVTLTTPLSVQGRTARFEHLPALIFPAGNEYRRCEFISTEWPGRGVSRIHKDSNLNYVLLNTDEPRENQPYEYDRTQHGRFVVRNYDAYADSDTEADYALVTFTLSAPRRVDGSTIHLEGDLTQRRLDDSSEMVFDEISGVWRKDIILKQGAYNYQYLTSTEDHNSLEGNKFQTLNEYTVAVYYRLPGDRYDRLGAFTIIPVSY